MLGTLDRNSRIRGIDRNTEVTGGHNKDEVHLIAPPSRMSSNILERGGVENRISEMENKHCMQGSL